MHLNSRLIVFTFILSSLISGVAFASPHDPSEAVFADLQKIWSPEIKGDRLVIKGRIDSHVYDFISREWTRLADVKTVELNSFGGNVQWALEVAGQLRRLKKITVIRSGGFCASACVYLYSVGVERWAARDIWFGIHGARPAGNYESSFQGLCFVDLESGPVFEPRRKGCQAFVDHWYEIALGATNQSFAMMEAAGVSPKLRSDYFAKDDDPEWPSALNVIRKPDWILDAPDAVPYSLVTKLID